ncbi:MAG: hypothetical protein QW356_03965 [Candidatus Hadarchaeales archaeon]
MKKLYLARWAVPTGLFVRDYLVEHGEASPYEMWRALKKARSELGLMVGSYESFRINYIRVLKKLKLIEPVRKEPAYTRYGRRVWDKTIYRLAPRAEKSPYWVAPQKALASSRRPDQPL